MFHLAMINMVDLYLDLGEPIRASLTSGNPKDNSIMEQLEAFAREAMRLDPPFAGVYREARDDKIIADVRYAVNERLFLSVAKANRDVRIIFFPPPVEPGNGNMAFLI